MSISSVAWGGKRSTELLILSCYWVEDDWEQFFFDLSVDTCTSVPLTVLSRALETTCSSCGTCISVLPVHRSTPDQYQLSHGPVREWEKLRPSYELDVNYSVKKDTNDHIEGSGRGSGPNQGSSIAPKKKVTHPAEHLWACTW
jgi:hypothetical protein